MDLTTLTDAELDQQRIDILNEQERRQRLADTPAQVAALAERYVADGGNPADLAAVLPTQETP